MEKAVSDMHFREAERLSAISQAQSATIAALQTSLAVLQEDSALLEAENVGFRLAAIAQVEVCYTIHSGSSQFSNLHSRWSLQTNYMGLKRISKFAGKHLQQLLLSPLFVLATGSHMI